MNVTLRQYTWSELINPFDDNTPITDDQFEALMAPVNLDCLEDTCVHFPENLIHSRKI